MRARTRRLLRRLAELPAVVVDHLLGPEAPADVTPREPAGADPAPEATVVVEHSVHVGPYLRQFGGRDPEDDGSSSLH